MRQIMFLIIFLAGCAASYPPELPEGKGNLPVTPEECLAGLDCSYAQWDGTRCVCLETSSCIGAGGTQSMLTECDGSENEICELGGHYCYLDQVREERCPETFSPRVLCEAGQ